MLWLIVLTQLALAQPPTPDALLEHAEVLELSTAQVERLELTVDEAHQVEQDLFEQPDLLREAAHLLFEEAMSVLTEEQRAVVRELLPPPPPHRFLVDHADALGLTAVQRVRLDQILQDREPELHALHRRNPEAAHRAAEKLMVELFAVLTPEQQQQAKQMLPPPPKNKRKE